MFEYDAILSKVFKGRFLVIRQPWGVIGRNVLNSLSLLFDGPRLNWDELRRNHAGK